MISTNIKIPTQANASGFLRYSKQEKVYMMQKNNILKRNYFSFNSLFSSSIKVLISLN